MRRNSFDPVGIVVLRIPGGDVRDVPVAGKQALRVSGLARAGATGDQSSMALSYPDLEHSSIRNRSRP